MEFTFCSFGLSAIFLIGGRSLNDKPVAILVRSGDTIIMSGESRLCYHGVPKVFSSENDLSIPKDSHYVWGPFKDYMDVTRININVRQVNKVV